MNRRIKVHVTAFIIGSSLLGYEGSYAQINPGANTIHGTETGVAAGHGNDISGNYSLIGGGRTNNNSGISSFIGGGEGNLVNLHAIIL